MAIGLFVALLISGGALVLIYWLYRISAGQPLRIPTARVDSVLNVAVVVLLAVMLGGGVVYMYQVVQADWTMRAVYTISYTRPIDYLIAWLILLPPIFWFGAGFWAQWRTIATGASGGQVPDEHEPVGG